MPGLYSSKKMKLAVFDFDGTLFANDTLPCLGREWLRQGRSPLRYWLAYLSIIPFVLLYKIGLLSRGKMKYMAMRIFRLIFTGLSSEEVNEYFQEAYHCLRKHLNQTVINEVQTACAQGFHTVLLSGAFANLLYLVAKDLGIETVLAVELPFKNGVFDAKGKMAFIDGESKFTLLQQAFADQEIDWQASRAYGDSYSDLAVLSRVGEPIAVNPEPTLLSHVRKCSWRVITT